MSQEEEKSVGVGAGGGEEKLADDPAVDLAKQNEQTIAQTNAIADAVKATQVQTAVRSAWHCLYSASVSHCLELYSLKNCMHAVTN